VAVSTASQRRHRHPRPRNQGIPAGGFLLHAAIAMLKACFAERNVALHSGLSYI